MEIIIFLVLFIGAYLLGSIPTAHFIFKRLTHGKDIRDYGSHNAGATNLRRAMKELGLPNHNKWFALTTLIDGAKATLPLMIIYCLFGYNWMMGPVGLTAVVGHIFPVFIPKPRFKGGKGAATAIVGVFLPLMILYVINHPQLGVICLATGSILIWGAIMATTRQMSSANIVLVFYISVLFFGISTVLTNDLSLSTVLLWGFIGGIAAVILAAHVGNWKRIIKGTETRV